MSKIIMLFWVMTSSGEITEPQRIGDDTIGFRTMEACEIAAESLTETNPKEQRTHGYAVIAKCIEVPR